MRRSIVRLAAAALVMALSAGACGGGSGSTRRAGSATTTTTAAAGATTSTAAGPELPKFQSDFKRVCTAQVGFSGATSYEPGPGPHPIALMEEYTGGWITTSRDLPQGWAVKEDSNFDDNSDLKPTQLVGCAHLAKQTPTGKKCDFDDKGTKVTLELVDSTFELTVYTATDSKPVHKATLQGTATECPMFATFKKGDTTYLNEPSDDQYIAALKPVVAP